MHFSRIAPVAAGLAGVWATGHGKGLGLDLDIGLDKGLDVDAGLNLGDVVDVDAGLNLGGEETVGVDAGVNVGGQHGVDADVDLGLDLDAVLDIVPALFDLTHSWNNEILFEGICAPATGLTEAVSLALNLAEAQVSGDVSLEVGTHFLAEPTVKLSLGGIKAFVAVDLSASAKLHETVELVVSPELSIDILDLVDVDLSAAIALDLIIGVSAAVDVSAGFYLAFADEAYIEISLLTKDIIDVNLEGLTAQTLPIAVGAAVDLSTAIDVQVGLRLRSQIAVSADIDIVGLDLLDGDVLVSIWANIFDYTAVLIGGSDCVLDVTEQFAVHAGLGIDIGVEVLDILDIGLAPSVSIPLSLGPLSDVCREDRGELGQFFDIGRPSEDEDSENVGEDGSSSGGEGSASESDSADVTGTVTATSVVTGTVTATVDSSAAAGITEGADMITSTVTSTAVYTITSCAVDVPNCPSSYTQKIVTSTVKKYTTVCPATQTAVPTTSASASTPVPVKTITKTMVTLVPCETLTTSTVTVPTTPAEPPVPTITITDSTTYCPPAETTAEESTAAPSTIPHSTIVASTSTVEVPETTVEVPTETSTKVTEVPTSPVVVPTTTPGTTIVTVPWPAPNSTLSSFTTVPHSTGGWVPPVDLPSVIPPPSTPTQEPPANAAGALRVGVFALALPAVVAALL